MKVGVLDALSIGVNKYAPMKEVNVMCHLFQKSIIFDDLSGLLKFIGNVKPKTVTRDGVAELCTALHCDLQLCGAAPERIGTRESAEALLPRLPRVLYDPEFEGHGCKTAVAMRVQTPTDVA